MLAIIILAGVFYVALNYAEKFQNSDSTISNSTTYNKSFKDNERHIDERVDLSIH